jgi:hypothetical protein
MNEVTLRIFDVKINLGMGISPDEFGDPPFQCYRMIHVVSCRSMVSGCVERDCARKSSGAEQSKEVTFHCEPSESDRQSIDIPSHQHLNTGIPG